MDDHKKILSRVQKMLNLANNAGATEGERDNAMRMAHSTLAKYNLDLADVDAHNGEQKKAAAGEPREQHDATFYGRPWARNVCQNIGKLFFCYYLYTSHKKATNVKHYFIGRHSNAITAALIAEFVVKSIMPEAYGQRGRIQQLGDGHSSGPGQLLPDRDESEPGARTDALSEAR